VIKVGLLSPFLPKKDGIAIYTNNLITHMDLEGIELVKIGDKDSDSKYKIDFTSFKLKQEIKSIIEEEKLDLIHIQYVPTLFGKFNLNLNLINALKQKIPVIVTLHEAHYSNDNLREFVLSLIEKKIIKNSDKIIVHTPQQKEFFEKKYSGNNISCIYHGLNFYDKNVRNNLNILFFGFITPLKGIEYLIDSMKNLQGHRLKIVGHIPKGASSDYKEELMKRTRDNELGSCIDMDIRWIPEDEKKEYFKWADMLVLPYLWGPYQSGVLHNAMSFGIPVVVTKVGSVHEIVELFKIGEVVPPKDSFALSDAVKKVFGNYTHYLEGVESYRTKANWREIAKQHKLLYQSRV